ncbi:asparagine synthase C-terminal domain-containing protein [Chitinimonas sp.]|uniref:asparagine synthetase B family protein n=1 Tax=Chitinimonas sp. TaxID=1934313 RepID=UPI002F95096C
MNAPLGTGLAPDDRTAPQARADSFCSGQPCFGDARLASMAASEGALRAWEQAFEQSGAQAPRQVEGHFSVALRTGKRVFLAVDRFAVQGLCYRQVGDSLRFAERADELASGAEIDPQAIFDYLFFHVIPAPRTIYKGVFRVPPGHYVLFEQGQLTVAPYWVAEFEDHSIAPFAELSSNFKDLLAAAVERQIGGLAPEKLGCFLSGGTDSSTVAGMVGKVSGQAAATYSIGFDAAGYDEMAYARIAAKHFGTRHHEYYVTPDDLVRSIGKVAGHYDQPFGNSSALPAYYCALMAKADGVERMLAGDGGDELFGGNSRYAKERVFGWYQLLPGGMRRGFMEPILRQQAANRLPLLRKAASYVEQASVPMPDRLQMYNLLLRLGVDQVLTAPFLAQVDQGAPLRQQREVWAAARTDSPINRVLAFDWRYTLADCDLPKVCGTTGLAGVSVGFPLLDDRLLAFSLQLPSEYKLKGLKLRWFFKEALRGFLPDEIITKKKQGFGLPFGVWTLGHAGLRELAGVSLQSLAERGIVHRSFVEKLMGERLAEHPGYYGEMVWILMMLEQWLQQHAPGYKL